MPKSGSPFRVHVVGPDAAVRQARVETLHSAGFQAEAHPDSAALLDRLTARPRNHCVVADVDDPIADGLPLLEDLRADRLALPVIIIDGDTSVETIARVFKTGAVDYLVRPVTSKSLVEAVEETLALVQQDDLWTKLPAETAENLSRLTAAERRIFDTLIAGSSNASTAELLGISRRTVEIHRGRIIVKLGAEGLVHLVRMVVDSTVNDLDERTRKTVGEIKDTLAETVKPVLPGDDDR